MCTGTEFVMALLSQMVREAEVRLASACDANDMNRGWGALAALKEVRDRLVERPDIP